MFLSTNGGLVLALAVGDLRIEESVGTGFSPIKRFSVVTYSPAKIS